MTDSEFISKVLDGEISINTARRKLGLPPIPEADEIEKQITKLRNEIREYLYKLPFLRTENESD